MKQFSSSSVQLAFAAKFAKPFWIANAETRTAPTSSFWLTINLNNRSVKHYIPNYQIQRMQAADFMMNQINSFSVEYKQS